MTTRTFLRNLLNHISAVVVTPVFQRIGVEVMAGGAFALWVFPALMHWLFERYYFEHTTHYVHALGGVTATLLFLAIEFMWKYHSVREHTTRIGHELDDARRHIAAEQSKTASLTDLITTYVQTVEGANTHASTATAFFEEIVLRRAERTEIEKQIAGVAYAVAEELLKHTRSAAAPDGFAGTYTHQMRLAFALCQLASRRFWATSTDPLLTFQRENAHYYGALMTVRDNIFNNREFSAPSQLPPVARVFVGSLSSLKSALDDDPLLFLETYRKHVLWGKYWSTAAALRFFIAGEEEFASKFTLSAGDLGPADRIEDFMLVDDAFVYGRAGAYSRQGLTLRLRSDPGLVGKYEAIYPAIYRAALTADDLLERFSTATSDSPYRLRKSNPARLRKHCRDIDQKVHLDAEYGTGPRALFPEGSRDGAAFFRQVTQRIANSSTLIVAVDVADSKTDRLWESWLHSPAYKAFREASIKAAATHKSTRVCRLFIIDSPPVEAERDAFTEFAAPWLEAPNISIAFLYRSDLRQIHYFADKALDLEFALDFILVDLPLDPEIYDRAAALPADTKDAGEQFIAEVDRANSFGFELFGDESFNPETLDWEKNLIPRRVIYTKVLIFAHVWKSAHVVHGAVDVPQEQRAAAMFDALLSRRKELADDATSSVVLSRSSRAEHVDGPVGLS